jgi:hypothetical protein
LGEVVCEGEGPFPVWEWRFNARLACRLPLLRKNLLGYFKASPSAKKDIENFPMPWIAAPPLCKDSEGGVGRGRFDYTTFDE